MANRRVLQREDTRRRLYEAALAVFRRDGVEGARIEDVVAQVGVSRGSFYFHFPTKEDVLVLAYAHARERTEALIHAIPEATPIAALLHAVVTDTAERWREDPALFALVGMHALRSVAGTPLAAERDSLRQLLAARFALVLERGELVTPLPAELLADMFLLNTFTGLLAWSANPGLPLGPVLEGVVHLFLSGVKPPG